MDNHYCGSVLGECLIIIFCINDLLPPTSPSMQVTWVQLPSLTRSVVAMVAINTCGWGYMILKAYTHSFILWYSLFFVTYLRRRGEKDDTNLVCFFSSFQLLKIYSTTWINDLYVHIVETINQKIFNKKTKIKTHFYTFFLSNYLLLR